MNEAELRQHLLRLMENDRVWCAYALADLDPAHSEPSTWLVSKLGVVLIYKGLHPPILFAYGAPSEIGPLFKQVPPGMYQYTLRESARTTIENRLHPVFELEMWRMVLDPSKFTPLPTEGVDRLGLSDLQGLELLFEGSADRPDAFHERQLESGSFWGIREGDEIVCIAGVHVISPWANVAAVGNVFTRPDRRGLGFATHVSAAVVNDLLKQGIQTIVLNVALNNAPALHLYQNLGFQPYCRYFEGAGKLG